MQERPGADVKVNLGAGKTLNLFDPQFIQRFDRAGRLTDRGSEGGKVMPPDQHICPGLHGIDIQLMIDLPHLSFVMCCGRAAHQDAKEVLAFNSREPGVPVIRHPRGLNNRNRLRFEVIVQRLGQAEGVPFLRKIAMRDLPQRMNTRIGAPGGSDGVRARLDAGQGLFYGTLH